MGSVIGILYSLDDPKSRPLSLTSVQYMYLKSWLSAAGGGGQNDSPPKKLSKTTERTMAYCLPPPKKKQTFFLAESQKS